MIFRACERGHAQLAELLLRYGADGRVHAVTRYSPLFIACSAGHIKVIELLLQASILIISVLMQKISIMYVNIFIMIICLSVTSSSHELALFADLS